MDMATPSSIPASQEHEHTTTRAHNAPVAVQSFRERAMTRLKKRKLEPTNPRYGSHHLIAGTMAGLLTTASLYPLDLVKTRYQVYDKGASPYGSLTTAFRAIIKDEGWPALYQGLGPALLGNAVAWGGFFYCYEKAKQLMQERMFEHELGPVHHLGAGMAAGAAMVFLTNPVWVIKTRMQLQNKKAMATGVIRPYTSFSGALATIVHEEGPLALYKGVVPALLLCTQGAVQFMVYEWLKARVPEHDRNTPLESLVMGGTSKVLASLATYPSQVIKSRLQQRGTEEDLRRARPRYRGTLHCVASIAKNEGLRGFFKGCFAYSVRAAPASAITFVVYEETLKVLDWAQPEAPRDQAPLN
ncbi:unnamed protein product [Discosporangium mesarthrocarpum]